MSNDVHDATQRILIELREEMRQRFDKQDAAHTALREQVTAIQDALSRQYQATGELYSLVIDHENRLRRIEDRTGLNDPEH